MLAFFLSPLGKVVGGLIAVLGIVGIIFTYLAVRDAGVRREALNQFNKKQMELVLKNQKEFIESTKRIEALQNKITREITEQTRKLEEQFAKTEEFINSPEAEKSNRNSSEILKGTIKRLGEQK